MSTKLNLNGKMVTITSDDLALQERLARYALELAAGLQAAGGRGEVAHTVGNIKRFVSRSRKHTSQYDLLKALVKKGALAHKEMVKIIVSDKGGKGLAGCRGSMSKNARASHLPENWWERAWDYEKRDYVITLREDVRAELKAELERE
jgi:hypothetical protein